AFLLNVLQIEKVGYAFKLQFTNDKDISAVGDVSNFKLLMTALDDMFGNLSIVDVATAFSLVGAGARFGVWVVGFVGMATDYSEALLAMKYRVKNETGEYSSGPMYYIERGLGKKWSLLAYAFAIFGAFAALGIGNSVQSNTIADVMSNSFH